MKITIGVIIGAIVAIAIGLCTYFYVSGFSSNSSNVLGQAQSTQPVTSNSSGSTSSTTSATTTGNTAAKTTVNNTTTNSNNNSSSTAATTSQAGSTATATTSNTTTSTANASSGTTATTSNSANFNALLKGPYIVGSIAGNTSVIISLNHPTISNGVMTLNEYYTNVPAETFSLKVVSPKANQFIMDEYYNGEHTGTYNLTLDNNQLSGTFTHLSNDEVSQVTLNIYQSQAGGYVGATPFLKGEVDNTPVVICTGGAYDSEMTEFYGGDTKSVFQIKQNYSAANYSASSVILDESYNGTETGVYNGTINSQGVVTGTYTKASNGAKSSFTLYPSYTN